MSDPLSDLFPPAPSGRPGAAEREARRRARDREARLRGIGWLLLAGAIVGVLLLGTAPSPYVIEQPGPVFDTLGEVRIEGEELPLIEIDGAESYPTEGRLDLLTVSIEGSPESRPSWLEVAAAWFQPSHAVVPLESIYPPGRSEEEADEQSAIDMRNSQQEAVAAALGELGIDYASVVEVVETQEGYPADGVFEPGDEILSAGGTPTPDVSVLRDAIARNGTERAMDFLVRRDGAERTLSVTPRLGEDGEVVVGVVVSGRYSFPFDVSIQLENVGGPSAGMMFALGIYDKLTPGALTGGEHVAGTGTIEAGGEVGPIGGIRQKMHGAVSAGAEWFLAPADNCAEVAGNVPGGLEVFAVSTLDEALETVEAIASGGDTGALARCEQG